MSQVINKFTLKTEFQKTVTPFLIYLATIIIYISFFKDVIRVGIKPMWLVIRLGYFPFILLACFVANKFFSSRARLYEFPLWAAGLYVTLFCSYFSLFTGGLSSDYFFGLLQFYFGIAIMPITMASFFVTIILSILIFVSINLIELGSITIPTYATISTLAPLIIFTVIVHIIIAKIRFVKLAFQNELAETIKDRDHVIQIQAKKLVDAETKAALGVLAAKVSHDIRSPLAAFEMTLRTLSNIPEETRILIHRSVSRMRDIANNLLSNHCNDELSFDLSQQTLQEPVLLSNAIESIISEKRAEYCSLPVKFIGNISQDAYSCFATICASEFKRILSNILNNAIESIANNGEIIINFYLLNHNVIISVEDNGCGIPEEILSALFTKQLSFGKMTGMGLGLYQAKALINSWSGDITIDSQLEKGTKVRIVLPVTLTPPWFMKKLYLRNNSAIVCLDDCEEIFSIWQARLKEFTKENKLSLIHFSNVNELIQWHNNSCNKDKFYLVDYEILNHHINGIDLIKTLKIEQQSLLVTSYFDDARIRRNCEYFNIRAIPKNFSVYMPIELIENKAASLQD